MLATPAWVWLVLALWAAGAPPACARDLVVGPNRLLKVPSQAATVAREGDRVLIDPGIYQDCAYWQPARLIIEARAPGVTITGPACFERGLFVVAGAGVTIRGITFTGARGQFHTAAGILGVGDDLTVENSQFLDNENGILLGGTAASQVRITGSTFRGNGSCKGACAHGLYAGTPIARLTVERCRFLDTRTAHHVKSRALTTIVRDSEIRDGDSGTASYLIDIPNGGNLLIEKNILQKGRNTGNPAAAISIGVEGARNATGEVIIRDNRFVSDVLQPTIFVRNSSPEPARLIGNQLTGKMTPLVGVGTVE